jgi:hypothetical protein
MDGKINCARAELSSILSEFLFSPLIILDQTFQTWLRSTISPYVHTQVARARMRKNVRRHIILFHFIFFLLLLLLLLLSINLYLKRITFARQDSAPRYSYLLKKNKVRLLLSFLFFFFFPAVI